MMISKNWKHFFLSNWRYILFYLKEYFWYKNIYNRKKYLTKRESINSNNLIIKKIFFLLLVSHVLVKTTCKLHKLTSFCSSVQTILGHNFLNIYYTKINECTLMEFLLIMYNN